MRYFTLLVCFLAACLSLLFVYRTTITERIIADRLQAIGATDIRVEVSDLNGHALRIASLHATFPKNSPLQSVQLQDLALHYDLSELVDGKVSELDIDTLQVTLNKQQQKRANSPPLKNIRSYLPEKIFIHKLILPVPVIAGDLTLELIAHNSNGKPLDIELGISGKQLSLPGWEAASLTGKLFLQTDNGRVISFQENSSIEIKDLQGVAAHLQEAHFLLSGKLTSSPEKGWLAGPATIIANTRGLQLQDLLIQPSSLLLQLEEQISLSHPFQFHSSLNTSNLLLQWKDKSVPLKDIQINVEADEHTLHLSVLLSHAIVPGQIEAQVTHNFSQNKGKARFTMPSPFTLNGKKTDSTQLLKGYQLPFLLHNGFVNCSGNMRWEDSKLLTINAGLVLSDGAGEYKNFTFSGLHIQQELQLYPVMHTIQPGTVFLNELYNGFTINNIKLRNQIIQATAAKLPTLLIDSLEAEILGGKVSSRGIRLDPVRQELDLLVQLHGIALDEVININKLNGLSVTGVMDGSIRIQWKNQQFSIPDGELHSRQPGGTISYLPPGGTAALSQLPAYAMKALQEFNYDTLIVIPRYEPDGMLNIAIHTEGHSPPLNTTRPVHLNLNTEQNILSLLQSLRYSKSLTDDLEQRLQTRPLKN